MRRSRDPSVWVHDRCQAAGFLLDHDVILLARGDGMCADEWFRAGERLVDSIRCGTQGRVG